VKTARHAPLGLTVAKIWYFKLCVIFLEQPVLLVELWLLWFGLLVCYDLGICASVCPGMLVYCG